MRYFFMVANILGCLTVLSLIGYTIQNESGHTGMNPYFLLSVFIPLLILGIVLYRRLQPSKWPAIMATILGLVGIALLVYLDKDNILLPYETWINRGMP